MATCNKQGNQLIKVSQPDLKKKKKTSHRIKQIGQNTDIDAKKACKIDTYSLLLLLYWLCNTVAESHKIKQLFTYCLHKIDSTVVILCEKALLDSPHRPWLEHLAWGTLSDTHRALHNERYYLLITTCSGWRDSAYTYPISQGVLATGIASKSHDMFSWQWGDVIRPVKLNCTA